MGSAAEHHARQIVVMKNGRLFDCSDAEDGLFGAHFVEAFATNNRKPIVAEPAVAGGLTHGDNLRIGVHLCHQRISDTARLGAFSVVARVV